MGELNPQVRQQLRVLAASKPLAPQVMAFRRGLSPPLIDEILANIREMPRLASGKQLLTLCKVDSIQVYPDSCLDTVRELLAARARLFPTNASSPAEKPHLPAADSRVRP